MPGKDRTIDYILLKTVFVFELRIPIPARVISNEKVGLSRILIFTDRNDDINMVFEAVSLSGLSIVTTVKEWRGRSPNIHI